MKAIHWIVAAALACSLPAPASAAVGSPEVVVYRFSGVKDDGNADFVGTATVFSCTNFSGVTETLRFVTRHLDGTIRQNDTVPINHLQTTILVTHGVRAYGLQFGLATNVVQGTTAIAATSTNILCTAMILDAANAQFAGVSLRGIRFNPAPGSQE